MQQFLATSFLIFIFFIKDNEYNINQIGYKIMFPMNVFNVKKRNNEGYLLFYLQLSLINIFLHLEIYLLDLKIAQDINGNI